MLANNNNSDCDQHTSDLIDRQNVMEYLVANKDIVNQFLNEQGLYHVFYRREDPHRVDESLHQTRDIMLVKSFATEESARQWIQIHGKDIVGEQEDNHNQPIVNDHLLCK